jgi:tetratricopeptide (TPR) repeat protein
MASRYPAFDYPRAVLARVRFDRARWLEREGRTEEALLDYLSAARLDKSGTTYREAFRDAVLRFAVPPSAPGMGEPATVDFRAAAFQCSGADDGACLLSLLHCLAKDDRHLQARLNLGSFYARLGFATLARREWQRCLEIDPSYAPAAQNLARLAATAPEAAGNADGKGSGRAP